MNTYTNYSKPGYSGYKKYGLNNISVARKVILFPKGTSIADITTASLEATWKTLLKNPMATRIHALPLALEVKAEGGGTIFEKAPLSGNIPVREDVTTLDFTYNVNPILATLLRSFNFKNWDVVFVDAFNNIMGWTPDGTKFKGLSTTSVFFGQMTYSDGSKSRQNVLSVSLADPLEWNNNPALIQGQGLGWFPLALEGTTGVNVVCSSASAAGFTAAVYATGLAQSDPQGQFPALAKADFTLTKGGVSQSLSGATMVDNGDGTYTFTGLTLANGTYQLSLVTPPSAISVVDYNIEVVNVGTFTLS